MYYLTISFGQKSFNEYYEKIKFFCIDSEILNDSIKLIKTEQGFCNELVINLNFEEFIQIKKQKWINYDPKFGILTILMPNSIENKAKVYKFNGEYFE